MMSGLTSSLLTQLLGRPKDNILKEQVVRPLYHNPCDSCDASCISETERSLKAQFLKLRRPSSTTSEASQHIHLDSPGNQVDMDGVQILADELRWFKRSSLNKSCG